MEIIILTAQGSLIYKTLHKDGGWLTIQEIAELIGKKQLSPHDRVLLRRMVEQGYVEEKQANLARFGRQPLIYRATQNLGGN